jgi:hypothetical protein
MMKKKKKPAPNWSLLSILCLVMVKSQSHLCAPRTRHVQFTTKQTSRGLKTVAKEVRKTRHQSSSPVKGRSSTEILQDNIQDSAPDPWLPPIRKVGIVSNCSQMKLIMILDTKQLLAGMASKMHQLCVCDIGCFGPSLFDKKLWQMQNTGRLLVVSRLPWQYL